MSEFTDSGSFPESALAFMTDEMLVRMGNRAYYRQSARLEKAGLSRHQIELLLNSDARNGAVMEMINVAPSVSDQCAFCGGISCSVSACCS